MGGWHVAEASSEEYYRRLRWRVLGWWVVRWRVLLCCGRRFAVFDGAGAGGIVQRGLGRVGQGQGQGFLALVFRVGQDGDLDGLCCVPCVEGKGAAGCGVIGAGLCGPVGGGVVHGDGPAGSMTQGHAEEQDGSVGLLHGGVADGNGGWSFHSR